ncbi:MAG: AEC family transporter [Albidovulum sp.]|nr:AEC family transporter [Albidovulum sp.]MDE0306558.1 AEC family transporter [Albidovulum sp.]MDE0533346.1 AEC family transporter [Albidovulum sp.]
MHALLEVTLPVFIIIGAGYVSVLKKFFSPSDVNSLMAFAQRFAIPCLLFNAISKLRLGENFDAGIIASFYISSTICFFLGILGAILIFGRTKEDAICIGFAAFFGNTVLLGLSIVDRAYGQSSMPAAYLIAAIDAPYCYILGITAMAIAQKGGRSILENMRSIIVSVFRNSFMVAIFLGFAVNAANIELPRVLTDSLDMISVAALPAALFALGGILVEYKPEGDLKVISMVCLLSLVAHPALAWLFSSQLLGLEHKIVRSATVMSAMAPGVNAYIFANMYDRAKRVAASSVLIGTVLSIATASVWLLVAG